MTCTGREPDSSSSPPPRGCGGEKWMVARLAVRYFGSREISQQLIGLQHQRPGAIVTNDRKCGDGADENWAQCSLLPVEQLTHCCLLQTMPSCQPSAPLGPCWRPRTAVVRTTHRCTWIGCHPSSCLRPPHEPRATVGCPHGRQLSGPTRIQRSTSLFSGRTTLFPLNSNASRCGRGSLWITCVS